MATNEDVMGPPCPYCGKADRIHDSAVNPARRPRPGSISVCCTCYQFCVFTTDEDGRLTLRLPNRHERRLIEESPQMQEVIRRVKKAATFTEALTAIRQDHRERKTRKETIAALILGTPCPSCAGTGHVCENHPDTRWGPTCCDPETPGTTTCAHGACHCGAGTPCPACCQPIPDGGRIGGAFTPRDRAAG